jgi:hypothetical protein
VFTVWTGPADWFTLLYRACRSSRWNITRRRPGGVPASPSPRSRRVTRRPCICVASTALRFTICYRALCIKSGAKLKKKQDDPSKGKWGKGAFALLGLDSFPAPTASTGHLHIGSACVLVRCGGTRPASSRLGPYSITPRHVHTRSGRANAGGESGSARYCALPHPPL